MNIMKSTREQISILEKPEYASVIIQILDGNNYATSIAKQLGKKQPTVTEQLNTLANLGVIELVKRGKTKTYRVNLEIIHEYFYTMVEEFVNARKKSDNFDIFSKNELSKLTPKDIRNAIPKELINGFLEFYAISVNLVGSKYKGFDELVISFFGALDKLGESKKEYLLNTFKINRRDFETITNTLAFENISIEKGAIETFLDTIKKGGHKSKMKTI